MRRLVTALTLSLTAAGTLAGAPAAGAARCAGADVAPAELGQAATVRTTLCLLNAERTRRGLRALRADARLRRVAGRHAGDMVARRYFAHDTKAGVSFVTRIKRTGWTKARQRWVVGENIGYGEGDFATPREMVKGWMHSRDHRANILARAFKVIGVGVADGAPTGDAGATYATDFGG
ncbi:MAG TPA: CAP domain-containing protein [Solirubrobacter sp.]|nr:CAP domain-containing protein [Solirubrobacter sp.]